MRRQTFLCFPQKQAINQRFWELLYAKQGNLLGNPGKEAGNGRWAKSKAYRLPRQRRVYLAEGGLASPKAGLPRQRRACLAEGGFTSPKAGLPKTPRMVFPSASPYSHKKFHKLNIPSCGILAGAKRVFQWVRFAPSYRLPSARIIPLQELTCLHFGDPCFR
jgi:hypothetical protein